MRTADVRQQRRGQLFIAAIVPVVACGALAAFILITPARGQNVTGTQIETTQTRPPEAISTTLSASEQVHATAWGLNEIEWRRYQSLKLGIRGSVSLATLSPLEVLGIHARDNAERRRYAERWARAMRDDAERILAFQHAYDAAAKRLFRGQSLINVGTLQTLPRKTSELRAEDRILFFTRVNCPACDAVLVKLLDHLESIAGIDIYILDVSASGDASIRAWAEQHSIKADWVQSRRVTLNHDGGALAKITDGPLETPALFLRRNGHVSKLAYAVL